MYGMMKLIVRKVLIQKKCVLAPKYVIFNILRQNDNYHMFFDRNNLCKLYNKTKNEDSSLVNYILLCKFSNMFFYYLKQVEHKFKF